MSKICDKQDDLKTTIKLLCLFKSRKQEEITFIRVAVSASVYLFMSQLLIKEQEHTVGCCLDRISFLA